uniref:DUF3085 domain-containing protein n=1 Tax=Escherichia coli TaxID=562 RepID=A0A0H3YDE7_ECOLX|nr:DUF3085 domain-containing protein [Escherichia coli]AKN19560.1 hypothetical protein pIGT15_p66 [Escherichia coli]
MTMQSELVFTDPMLNVVIAEVKRFNCPLLFVKDHGVYVMAAKGEKNSNGMHNVCYANGFNPDTTDFDELWDKMCFWSTADTRRPSKNVLVRASPDTP